MEELDIKKQQQEQLMYKIQYLKLRRILELNNKLRQELSRERITASNACLKIIDYTTSTRDFAVPALWGFPERNTNPYNNNSAKKFNQYSSLGGSGLSSQDETCCTIM